MNLYTKIADIFYSAIEILVFSVQISIVLPFDFNNRENTVSLPQARWVLILQKKEGNKCENKSILA